MRAPFKLASKSAQPGIVTTSAISPPAVEEVSYETKNLRILHNFASIPVHSTVPLIQPKLSVNTPGDKYEQEADVMADRVMRMPEEGIQRNCSECTDEEEKLQRKSVSNTNTLIVNPQLNNSIQSSRGKGHNMDSNTESFMSARFGVDFSKVRIHYDRDAVNLNQQLNARAFTIGNDIYFNAFQYQPQTKKGKHLLAHELTHVIQQNENVIRRQEVCEPVVYDEEEQVCRPSDPYDYTPQVPDDPLLEAEKQVKEAINDIETNWKEITNDAASFKELSPWKVIGDEVLKHIHSHTTEAIIALRKGDMDLFRLYLEIVESDKTMYDVIAWYISVYTILLSIKSDIISISDSFKADDRQFSGRAACRRSCEIIGRFNKCVS